MALTQSTMLPLGTQAPDFSLPDVVSGNEITLHTLKIEKAIVIMFICNHCPFVKHLQTAIVELASSYQNKGIQFIAISANDPQQYPEDAPEAMKKVAAALHYPFPYLFDASQETAKAYQAACTPDFYIFNHHLQCVYRGRFDDSTPSNRLPVTGQDIRLALDQVLAGQPVSPEQAPSIGCNIKWKSA